MSGGVYSSPVLCHGEFSSVWCTSCFGNSMKYEKPVLRWAGGKHSQLPQILPLLPSGDRLIEPFVGAGSVFLNAGFSKNIINDLNPHLIYVYRAIFALGTDFIDKARMLHTWTNSQDAYKELVKEFNSGQYSENSLGIFFTVLNRTSFNGLCRYNKKGEYNVPWGHESKTYFPEKEIEALLSMPNKPTMMNSDFKSLFKLARSGDVIFCDPPYEPMPGKKGFTTYTGSEFTMDHQNSLIQCALNANKAGAKVVITNSSASHLVDSYVAAGFDIHPLVARRRIAASVDSRQDANDIIAILK